ncbi:MULTISPECIES: hypothetical protein [Lysinibacillus]|uniref:hypothetical protein n=1 Tax=Lysinibacillus TaxID=400634 RepID=UPI00214BDA28|nr:MULTISPECIES: hypothetical protein [Lysinibacillus]UUV26395.1 hypothetical protein NP781_07265 [Lysinibacillus sp. FN11]UYB49276.1 hypothetical protein OCI51_10015 [Lysinibacillus capsici]
MKVSNKMKVNIIVCLIGIIFIGIYTIKQYQYMTECNELRDENPMYDQKACVRILKGGNNNEEIDWDAKDAKFKHDLYKEAERLQKEGY